MFPNNPYSPNPYQPTMYGQVQQPPMPQLSTLQQTQAKGFFNL